MQLAVEGEVGPVVRSALLRVASRARHCTVLRLAVPPDVDMLAVMEALDSEGLHVTSVRCVTGRSHACAPDAPREA
jgi:hypothetical protein